jgi:hypothetical protein
MIVEKLMDYGRSLCSLLGERRKSDRFDFQCNIMVSSKNRYGQLTTHLCKCLNVSEKGLGFVSPDPIAEDADIYIHSETHNLKRFARVRYCVRRGEANYVGCMFRHAPEFWN